MLYIKWIGALLIIAGCSGIGFSMAMNCRREQKALEDLSRALSHIASELEFRQMPLPDIFLKIGQEGTGCVYSLFTVLGQALNRQVAPNAGCCLDVVLRNCQQIPATTACILKELGMGLGQYDIGGQLRNILSVKDRCDREINLLTNQKEERIRRYQTLGICTGAAIVILLL